MEVVEENCVLISTLLSDPILRSPLVMALPFALNGVANTRSERAR
jgi:hypothetical protein